MVEVILTCILFAGQVFVPHAEWKILNIKVVRDYPSGPILPLKPPTQTTIQMSRKMQPGQAYGYKLLPKICGGAIIEIAENPLKGDK